jgi:hypothetical protein
MYDLLLLDAKYRRNNIKICFVTASELFYEEFREKRDIDEKYFILKPMKNKEMIERINNTLLENEEV